MSKEEIKSASEADVARGAAVFHVPEGRSRPYDLGRCLPIQAHLSRSLEYGDSGHEIPVGTPITIVQAEIVDEDYVLIGFHYADGTGVCPLDQVSLD